MGYLNASKSYNLTYDSINPDEWLEYKFNTNYKKVLFDLATIPDNDDYYKQRIIISNLPYDKCPQKCSEEPNYWTAITNRHYAKTEAMISRCFPTFYIYVINIRVLYLNLIEDDHPSYSDAYSEFKTTMLNDQKPEEGHKLPVFDLTPKHLEAGCRVAKSDIPECAPLSKDDCINPGFCTTNCSLLTCRSDEGNELFSVCTSTNSVDQSFTDICSAHANFNKNYTLSKCENPIVYNPSLPQSVASILLLLLATMMLMIICICCYNIHLTRTNKAPCDVCPFCPQWLFPRPIEDNPLYQDDNDEI